MIFKTKITDIIQRTHDVKSYRFSKPDSFEYTAGQYLIISLPNGKGGSLRKPLTLSSSPTEDFIEVTKKLTDGHEFSEAFKHLDVGDEVQLDAPYGQFVLDEKQNKIAMLSGGIGITPFRSICRYATDLKLKTDIFLFYGNKTSKDIVFKQEFDQMKDENQQFKIVYTLTRQDPNWTGQTGHIDANLIKNELPDYSQRMFYLCGPPGMMKAMQDFLQELGVTKQKISVEKFPTN
ncbi:MAG: xylene monooxygenase [Candidatus Bathyarchaeota archaeon]|nr:FAD-binding oxidoreductase [Candidatus Bathyarchaeum tardum]WGM88730.1 MAG: FAD-binding oxidoreductase [Candidatus Bathyarchaeum tardum]WNZ29016.1 MAG: xylene monooxygenase [Candidatus Bathyarchaeota archaeon]